MKARGNGKLALNVLVAEDNPNDVVLLERALPRNGLEIHLRHVQDGTEVIDYLQGVGHFANRAAFPMPDVILLDLKMPKLTGFDVLHWMRDNNDCGQIPTVLFSGSGLEKDVEKAYALGANTYFEKPTSYAEFARLLKILLEYWARSKRPSAPHSC